MKSNEDFEFYLYKMECDFVKLQEGMWTLHDVQEDVIDNLVIVHKPPIVLFRVKLMEWTGVEAARREDFFRLLLELNIELVHGSFALEGDNVVVLDTLQAENLDFNEFQASIDALTMAVEEFYPRLSGFRASSGEELGREAGEQESVLAS